MENNIRELIKNGRIELVKGDITRLKVDAIVNAANKSLLGGGGVDGAIHRAAGPLLLDECKKLGGCVTGEAKITKAYQLPVKNVIHTVGPVWQGGNKNEAELLASAYLNSLVLAKQFQLHKLAFPSISTGVYSFPKSLAAQIACETVGHFLMNSEIPWLVTFVVFDDENLHIYRNLLFDL